MFWIDPFDDTMQFASALLSEEVGGKAGGGYASPGNDAEGLDHFLRQP